jgi:hypothetical protein
MGDPLSDPRAQQLLNADPGEVGSLASQFRNVANQAERSAAALRGAHGDGNWTGGAADAFRTQLGKLPGDLAKVHQSYIEVAQALDAYEAELGPLQSQFRSLSEQLTSARSSLGTAQNNLATAKGNLNTATQAPHAASNSPAVVDAHTAVTSASGAVGNLEGEVSGLEARSFRILDQFDSDRGRARSAVSSASGIAPSHSWLSGVFHSIGNFVTGAVKDVYHDITDLPHAIKNVWEHPGSLAAWGELAKDLATTAAVVAIAAAPFAAPELLEADAAIDGAADAAGDGARDGAGQTASKGFDRLRTNTARNVSNVSGKASTGFGLSRSGTEFGQGDWKGGLTDLAFTALPNAGSFGKAASEIKGIDNLGSFGKTLKDGFNGIHSPGELLANKLGVGDAAADASKEATEAWGKAAETVKDYRLLRALGLNKAFAERNVFSDGMPKILQGQNLDDASGLAAHGKALLGQANGDAAKALHVGRPLAGAVDKLVVEPVEHRIHDAISPEPVGAG